MDLPALWKQARDTLDRITSSYLLASLKKRVIFVNPNLGLLLVALVLRLAWTLAVVVLLPVLHQTSCPSCQRVDWSVGELECQSTSLQSVPGPMKDFSDSL